MKILQQFNWDYLTCLKKQEELVKEVSLNPTKQFLILTSHPPCFTIGKGKESQDLEEVHKILKFPVYKIHRGGGLTFHHPGQLIVYFIRKLDGDKLKLKDHISHLLEIVSQAVKTTTGLSLEARMDPLGLWNQNFKVASLGVGLKKFVTFHGLALNINHHQEIFKEIEKLNPCGLSPCVYKALESLVPEIEYEKVKETILEQISEPKPLVPPDHSQNCQ